MALELKIRVTTIDAAFTYFRVDDENDTLDLDKQYGQSGNPLRADLGLFLYVTKKEVGDAVDSLVFGPDDNTDPGTAATWQVTYNEDNWFEHILIAATNWDTNEAGYVANDLVTSNGRLWLAVAPVQGSTPGAVTGEWTDTTESNPNDIITASTGTFDYNTTLNDTRLEISSVHYAKSIAANSKNGQCLLCDHDDKKREELIRFHLNAAQVATDQQLFTQAQYNVVTLKDLCAT